MNESEQFELQMDEKLEEYLKPRNRAERRAFEKAARSKPARQHRDNFKEYVKQETYKALREKMKERGLTADGDTDEGQTDVSVRD